MQWIPADISYSLRVAYLSFLFLSPQELRCETRTRTKEEENPRDPRPRATRSARRRLLRAYKRGACSREEKSPGSQPITPKSLSTFAARIMLLYRKGATAALARNDKDYVMQPS